MEFFEMNFDESFVAKETRVGNGCVDFSAPELIANNGCSPMPREGTMKTGNTYSRVPNKPLTNLGGLKNLR